MQAPTGLVDPLSRRMTVRESIPPRPLAFGRSVHRAETGPSHGRAEASERATGKRILVADDESSIRILCRLNLELAGMEVLEAADGEEALARVAEARPDLVLLDVMMPGLDGWEVAERLTRDPATRDLPIVFLTARADGPDRERGLALGAVGYVLKPFDPVALADELSMLLERLRAGEREKIREELRRRS